MTSTPENTDASFSLVEGHTPQADEIQFSIGHYQILSSIGKGGMGEVFLAYDTVCGRRIALKRIRPDLLDFKQINYRFLKEAHITCQLTHPSIIPIYAIHKEEKGVYYTMPFVQGETLKQILRKTKGQVRKGEKLDHVGGSIPALMRIFVNICQAVAYAHSKDVLHRDLKPENIIVGPYGEVLILDWGLAKLVHQPEENLSVEPKGRSSLSGLTLVGKIVGTVSYMAPERAQGLPATFQTDIYALGVTLYQLLTLRLPFRRKSLQQFRKNAGKETLRDPADVAPYRDVPRILAKMAMKCLSTDPAQRYASVDELLFDLESYLEGRAEWFQMAELRPDNKKDWEFQENVFLAEHMAITRAAEASDWMNLMISKASFAENIRLEARIKIGPKGHGIGFLLNVPEAAERRHLNDGYCLWMGSDLSPSTKLLRSTVEVIQAPEVELIRGQWYDVRIDKVDDNIHIYLNDILQFSYISHLPLFGTHVGLLARDVDYEIKNFNISIGGQNVMVKCLAVPDAFLAHKDYTTALSEYRRIGYAFAGRAEGREAMFRAGITLLEQARSCPNATKALELYDEALVEFEKLHTTPGAPLEYLGKALVYQTLHEYDEEIKCFELGYRRYPNHPLLNILQEHILYRMHECSRHHRLATYQFVLLGTRHLPNVTSSKHVKRLFSSLKKYWEPLPFIAEDPAIEESILLSNLQFSIQLAFWLDKPYVLEEVLQEILDDTMHLPTSSTLLIGNILFSLLNMQNKEVAESALNTIKSRIQNPDDALRHTLACVEAALKGDAAVLAFSPIISFDEERAAMILLDNALQNDATMEARALIDQALTRQMSNTTRQCFDARLISALLLEKKWEEAGKIFNKYSMETLSHESSPFFSLYGCWLYASEGKELAQIHFNSVLETTYPRTWTLLAHFLSGRIHEQHVWFQRAFMWEKRQLYRQLYLFYKCTENEELARYFRVLN
jgi:Serine/threonine protein kinase